MAFVRSPWLPLLAVLALAALVLVPLRGVLGQDGAKVVGSSAAKSGWQTIEYQGIQVDIPEKWERSDRDDCEFRFEHWGPPQLGRCDSNEGVAFYASATFDPAHGPGVRLSEPPGGDDVSWAGWIRASDDYTVWAADSKREVVEDVLDSVQQG